MPEQPPHEPLARPVVEANWRPRIALLVVLAALLGLAYFISVTVVPRWWAHRVGDRVDGSLTAGAFFGLFVGFVFTFVPLLILRQVFRHLSNPWRLALLLLALVAAVPNLMTLAIVLGSDNAAHAGERILDVEGPGFRAGSAWGAVVAAALALALLVWTWQVRRDRRRLRELRSERRSARPDREGERRDGA